MDNLSKQQEIVADMKETATIDMALFDTAVTPSPAPANTGTPLGIPKTLGDLIVVMKNNAQAALDDMDRDGQLMPSVLVVGADGNGTLIRMRIENPYDERDMAMLAWLNCRASDARLMISVIHAFGRRHEDPPGYNNRRYLVVSGCLRENETVHRRVSMTELSLPPFRSNAIAPPEEVPAFTDGPSFHGFPERRPGGAERAEARRRLTAAQKRLAKRKPPFVRGESPYAMLGLGETSR